LADDIRKLELCGEQKNGFQILLFISAVKSDQASA